MLQPRRRRGDRAALAGRPAGAAARGRPTGRAGRRRSRCRRSSPAAAPTAAARAPPAAGAADVPGVHASPSVRRLARELDVDLGSVTGTGAKGRITKDDVLGFLRGPAQARRRPPRHPRAAWASRRSRPRTSPSSARSRPSRCRASRSSPARSCTAPGSTSRTSPTTTRPTSPSSTPTARSSTPPPRPTGYRVTLLAFLMKACVSALKQFPEFNSSLSPEKDSLILKKYYNIGIAVDTPDGLVVPVVKDVDRKGIVELSKELGDISKKARDGKLVRRDMQGGTLHHLQPRRHRRHELHADRQRARGGDPRRGALEDDAGLERHGVRAAADAAALAVLRPPRDRRRAGRPLHPASVPRARGRPPAGPVTDAEPTDTGRTMSASRSRSRTSATSRTCRSSRSTSARRRRHGRGPAGHAGDRQGHHGRAGPGGRHRVRAQGRGRRHGVAGSVLMLARGRGCGRHRRPRSRCTKARIRTPASRPATAPRAGVYETIEVKVPDIGDFKDVPVIEVHVSAGDTVTAEDPLITLESDKATMDVPSPAAGTVDAVKVKVGDTGLRGHLILDLRTGEAPAAARAGRRAGTIADGPAAGDRARRPPRRGAGAGRRARRLHRRVPRRRPRQAGRAGRARRERSAGSASTSAASRPRRCCTPPR